jgi:hypothetical protein
LSIFLIKTDGSRTLVVPVVKSAEEMSFAEFVAAYEDLIRKVRTNKLTPDDFKGATITLTNPGTIGTVQSVPRLMPGQGVIVGAQVLEIALRQLLAATAFFQHPAEGLDYLRQEGIAYVVRANPGHLFAGATPILGTSDTKLSKAPFLHEVLRTPAATVYRVDGWRASTSVPDPEGQPGFCPPAG